MNRYEIKEKKLKVLPQLTTKIATNTNIVTIKMPKNGSEKLVKLKHVINNISSQARENLERYAEEMKPETYLEMRNYISRLEMEELMRNGKL